VPIRGVDGCPQGDFVSGSLPDVDVSQPGLYAGAHGDKICTSFGPFDDYVMVGLGPPYVPGVEPVGGAISVPFDLLAQECTQPPDLAGPIRALPFRSGGGAWIGGLCETNVDWRVDLWCGRGPWQDIGDVVFGTDYRPEPYYTDCELDARIYYRLGIAFEVEERAANNRPDPLDWGYELVTRGTF